jgi:hypothetical protein
MHWENAEARPLPVAELGECYRVFAGSDGKEPRIRLSMRAEQPCWRFFKDWIARR